MNTYIDSVSGIIQIYSDNSQAPRCYYGQGGTSGKSYPIPYDRYLINIGGDSYELYWEDMRIGGNQPISFIDADRMLGEVFTTGVVTQAPPPPPTTLKIDQSTNFDIAEDEDFTIEWFMNMSSDAYFPRAYSIGAYPSAANALSIEGGTFIWWANSGLQLQVQLPEILNAWHHVAIVRYSGDVTIYFDGTSLGSLTYSNEILGANDLYIGSENASETYLDGKMGNFRWVTGTAVYTDTFTPPTNPLEAITNTRLLILQGTDLSAQLTDNSGYENVITNIDTTFSSDSPFSGYVGSTLFGNF
jgi:hypothetical protein